MRLKRSRQKDKYLENENKLLRWNKKNFLKGFQLPKIVSDQREHLSLTRNKKKHDKILMLAKRKSNNIETLVSQALIDMEISHEEFVTTLKEKNKYWEDGKKNIRNVSRKLEEKAENMRLNSINSRTQKKEHVE